MIACERPARMLATNLNVAVSLKLYFGRVQFQERMVLLYTVLAHPDPASGSRAGDGGPAGLNSIWNEYLFALKFPLVSKTSQMVPVVIASFGGYDYEVPDVDRVAARVIVTIPVLVLVLLFQRRIIERLMAGVVKG